MKIIEIVFKKEIWNQSTQANITCDNLSWLIVTDGGCDFLDLPFSFFLFCRRGAGSSFLPSSFFIFPFLLSLPGRWWPGATCPHVRRHSDLLFLIVFLLPHFLPCSLASRPSFRSVFSFSSVALSFPFSTGLLRLTLLIFPRTRPPLSLPVLTSLRPCSPSLFLSFLFFSTAHPIPHSTTSFFVLLPKYHCSSCCTSSSLPCDTHSMTLRYPPLLFFCSSSHLSSSRFCKGSGFFWARCLFLLTFALLVLVLSSTSQLAHDLDCAPVTNSATFQFIVVLQHFSVARTCGSHCRTRSVAWRHSPCRSAQRPPWLFWNRPSWRISGFLWTLFRVTWCSLCLVHPSRPWQPLNLPLSRLFLSYLLLNPSFFSLTLFLLLFSFFFRLFVFFRLFLLLVLQTSFLVRDGNLVAILNGLVLRRSV